MLCSVLSLLLFFKAISEALAVLNLYLSRAFTSRVISNAHFFGFSCFAFLMCHPD